jgi:hypothetical protein
MTFNVHCPVSAATVKASQYWSDRISESLLMLTPVQTRASIRWNRYVNIVNRPASFERHHDTQHNDI